MKRTSIWNFLGEVGQVILLGKDAESPSETGLESRRTGWFCHPPPACTEVKKTRSLSPSAEPDEGRVVWSNSDANAELAKGLGPEYVSSRRDQPVLGICRI